MVCNNCALYMLLYKQCRGFYRCSKRVVNARSVFQEHHLVPNYFLTVTHDCVDLKWLYCGAFLLSHSCYNQPMDKGSGRAE